MWYYANASLTVYTGSNFAFRRFFTETFTISMAVEKESYAEAVAWLRDVVSGSIFTKERLEVIIAKELQNLPAQKRDGDAVARAWLNRLCFDVERSPSEASSLLKQLEFLPKISDDLKENPDAVIKALEDLRAHRKSAASHC